MAGRSFFSQSWYRVADLKPRLRSHVTIRRHRYRGQGWYVIFDHASGRTHRFTPAAYLFIGRMDGSASVEAIWTGIVAELADDAPSQDDVVRLLSQLHAADLLQSGASPDVAELFERHARHERSRLKQRFLNPLSLRFALWDPDDFLTRTLPLVRPLLGWFGLMVWLAVVLPAIGLTAFYWPELTANLSDRVLAATNVLLIWICYPVIKAFHELGHGYTVKAAGGEVHEMGIMLLVFFPVPYVDASAAAAFPDKRQRMLVGAAGILVEVFLASLAILVWVAVEPGFVRALAFNFALIGGVSTVLFNGNPLLRFDGYYVFADLIEIPNLGKRATAFWGRLVERYGFGAEPDPDLHYAPGERFWLAVFAPASFAYRLVIIVGIALFVAETFFGLGVVIAVWGLVMALLWPLLKSLHHVISHDRLHRQRRRAVAVTFGGIAAVVAGLLLVPLPLQTTAEAVLWLPESAQVRAGTEGFVAEILAPPGTAVAAGRPLFRAEEPVLEARIAVIRARVVELTVRYEALAVQDRVQAALVAKEVAEQQAYLEREEGRRADLVARSGADGVFLVPRAEDLPGRFVRRGDVLGYIALPHARIARVAVGQDNIDLVRGRLRAVDVKLVHHLDQTFPAELVREVPSAANELPSLALSSEGGGRFALDPGVEDKVATFERVFQFDLRLPEAIPPVALGSRIYVRFHHDWEPLGLQWYRRLRQLLLSHFDL